MNIQHSQQIQQIRYAKQYTAFARRPASRRRSRSRRFGIAFTAIAAMVGFSGAAFTSSAQAQRPTEGESVATTAPTANKNTVTSPCFRGANVPFASYEAAASECTVTYGAPDDSFGIQAGGGPSEGAKEAGTDGWMHHIDNIYGYEQFVPAAETDGWAHHVHTVQVPAGTDEVIVVTTDGWAHRTDPVPDRSAWRDCFNSGSTYHAWMKIQVGMPKCAPSDESTDAFSPEAMKYRMPIQDTSVNP
jgi:hypothetical protein